MQESAVVVFAWASTYLSVIVFAFAYGKRKESKLVPIRISEK